MRIRRRRVAERPVRASRSFAMQIDPRLFENHSWQDQVAFEQRQPLHADLEALDLRHRPPGFPGGIAYRQSFNSGGWSPRPGMQHKIAGNRDLTPRLRTRHSLDGL